MEGKKRKFALQLRPSRRNYIGVFLSLVGFILVLLCLIGARSTGAKRISFATITANPPGPLTIYLGWQGYCIDDKGETTCYNDDGVMMLPFGTLCPRSAPLRRFVSQTN